MTLSRARMPGLLLGLAAIATLPYAVYIGLADSLHTDGLFDLWVYHLPIALAAAACLIRGAQPPDRGAWTWIGLGLALWTFADIYFVAITDEDAVVSLADAGFLGAIACLYVGIALFARAHLGRRSVARWLDGAIAGIGAAALATALLAPVIADSGGGADLGLVIINLAYPIGDVVLIGLLAVAVVLSGRAPSRVLLLIGAGLLLWTGADIAYLMASTAGETLSDAVDLVWVAGALLIAAAAAERPEPQHRRGRLEEEHALPVMPIVAIVVAVGVMVWDHYERTSLIAVILAALTLGLAAIRLAVSGGEINRLVRRLTLEATVDPLTRLANRRKLLDDLEAALVPHGHRPGRHLLAIFDLDGFKTYNDAFGHPAGDALLRRLGAQLAAAIGPRSTAYRLGGDEFCVLRPLARDEDPAAATERLLELADAALSEQGEGFSISASSGSCTMPSDAQTPTDALTLADNRMYLAKSRRIGRRDDQTTKVLLRALTEHDSELGAHVEGVGELAVKTARRLALDAEQIDAIFRAAELHDVGKIAIPDEILGKAGPLSASERELVEQHTVIGERILTAAPALRPVGELIRSSHERWDGSGYPDGLAGEKIPIGSRIILISDAFDAMTSERPYQRGRSVEEALAELDRCAGTQFDAELVEVFRAVVKDELRLDPGRTDWSGPGEEESFDPPAGR